MAATERTCDFRFVAPGMEVGGEKVEEARRSDNVGGHFFYAFVEKMKLN
jgi:hypothetical protein